jgi:hypothetical protein
LDAVPSFIGVVFARQSVHAGRYVEDQLREHGTFAIHLVRVLPQDRDGALAPRTRRGGLFAQAEQLPLYGVTVTQQRFEMRQHVNDRRVQDLKLAVGEIGGFWRGHEKSVGPARTPPDEGFRFL